VRLYTEEEVGREHCASPCAEAPRRFEQRSSGCPWPSVRRRRSPGRSFACCCVLFQVHGETKNLQHDHFPPSAL
jgi:hypothetical protein